jgi:hypothetical protein
VRPRALEEHVADLLARRHVAAGRAAERFPQRRGDHVDLAEHAEVLGHAATRVTHDARPVRVVDEDDGVVRARELEDAGQLRQVALHREHAIRDHELALPRLARLQASAQLVHRRMAVDDLARRPGEPDRVDDRGVVERVREDDRVLVRERRDRRLVRVPARDVGERRIRTGEVGQLALELEVRLERPADEADGCGSRAVAAQALDPGLDDLRPVREPEVVVRREHEHLAPALHLHDGALRRGEDVRGLVGAGLAESGELRAERLVEPGARDAHLCVHLPGPDEASTGSRAGASTCCRTVGRPPG